MGTVPPPTGAGPGSPGHALVLGALTLLFAGRVAGQALVALSEVRGLPPMSEWASGLLPYPLLLASQAVILVVQGRICRDVWRGRGRLGRPRAPWAWRLRTGALLYAGIMAARYGVTMALHPERRWLGTGVIPIAFHFVLAAFLLTLAHFHGRAVTPGR
jgi:hypothetical protein